MRHITNLFLAALTLLALTANAQTQTVASPDGNIRVNFDLKAGKPYYNVDFHGKRVIRDSYLGLELNGQKDSGDFKNFDNKSSVSMNSLYDGFTLTDTQRATFDETWQPVWGEESSIRNHYNEMAVTLRQSDFDRYIVVRFRVYDDGVGFRYEFPQQKNLNYFVIKEELTQFAMPGDITAWWIGGDYDTQE